MSAATRAKIAAALRGRHHPGIHKAKKGLHHRFVRIHLAPNQGTSNAQVLHIKSLKSLKNEDVLNIKLHRKIRGPSIGTNRAVIIRNEHRRRRRP